MPCRTPSSRPRAAAERETFLHDKRYRGEKVSPLRARAPVETTEALRQRGSTAITPRKVFTFNMEGLGRDQPVAVDAVIAEVVDVQDRVDPDAHLDQRLVAGSDVHQKNLFVARRVLRSWRRRARESVAVRLSGQQVASRHGERHAAGPSIERRDRSATRLNRTSGRNSASPPASKHRRRREPFRIGRSWRDLRLQCPCAGAPCQMEEKRVLAKYAKNRAGVRNVMPFSGRRMSTHAKK